MTKRYRIEGSIFYITSNIYNRINVFTRPSFIIPIIDSLNYYRYQYACKLLGYVIMPDAEYKLWQDSFWEQCIYTEEFVRQKLNYIHLNPKRAGLVEAPADYPYSSYRNYYLNDHQLIEIDNDWIRD